MRPEIEPVRLARQWLDKSAQDLRGAELMAASVDLLELVAFHCQQAAEKALKGYLTLQDRPFRRTHNLVELLRQCTEIDERFADLVNTARMLSPYAADLRYPGDVGDFGPDEATAAVARAHEVLAFVQACMPPREAT